jgi:hypothetical protein
VKRSKARRGASCIELLLAGFLLFFLLGATVLLRRFVAPAYRPLVLVAGLLLAGVWLWAVIAQLRYEARMSAAWAGVGRRLLEYRRACASLALVLPEGLEWSSQRGLLDDGTGLPPETRERLAHAGEHLEKVLTEQKVASVGSVPGELILRRSADQWQLHWRVEGEEDRLYAEGPLQEETSSPGDPPPHP